MLTFILCRQELRSSPHILILEKLLLPPAGSSLVLGWRDEFIAYTKNSQGDRWTLKEVTSTECYRNVGPVQSTFWNMTEDLYYV